MSRDIKSDKLTKYGHENGFNLIRGDVKGKIFLPNSYGHWYHRTDAGTLIPLGDSNRKVYALLENMVERNLRYGATGEIVRVK